MAANTVKVKHVVTTVVDGVEKKTPVEILIPEHLLTQEEVEGISESYTQDDVLYLSSELAVSVTRLIAMLENKASLSDIQLIWKSSEVAFARKSLETAVSKLEKKCDDTADLKKDLMSVMTLLEKYADKSEVNTSLDVLSNNADKIRTCLVNIAAKLDNGDTDGYADQVTTDLS